MPFLFQEDEVRKPPWLSDSQDIYCLIILEW